MILEEYIIYQLITIRTQWKVVERKLGEIHLFEDEIKDIDEYMELNNYNEDK